MSDIEPPADSGMNGVLGDSCRVCHKPIVDDQWFCRLSPGGAEKMDGAAQRALLYSPTCPCTHGRRRLPGHATRGDGRGGDARRPDHPAFNDEVMKVMEMMKARAPEGIEFQVLSDQPTAVERRIHHVVKCFIEAVLIVIIVGLFLMDWRLALVLATAVPLTVAMTLIGMQLLHILLQQIWKYFLLQCSREAVRLNGPLRFLMRLDEESAFVDERIDGPLVWSTNNEAIKIS